MRSEAYFFRVFKNKKTIFTYYSGGWNKVWQFIKPWEVIWRICKNNSVFKFAGIQISFYIDMYRFYILKFHFINHLSYKWNMLRIFLYKVYYRCSPWGKFITDTSGPGKQIKNINSFEINTICKNVEETLPGIVGGRSCRKIWRWIYSPSFIFTADYTQFTTLIRFMYLWRLASLNT